MTEDDFVSFVRETEGVELKEYNQDGGGLFVEIIDVNVRDELSEMECEECGEIVGENIFKTDVAYFIESWTAFYVCVEFHLE